MNVIVGGFMIYGIGIDLCSISRIEKALRQKGFKERVFSEEEIKYAETQARPARHYAASFATKEAVAKATGWGLAKMGFKSLFVKRTPKGPTIIFNKQTEEKLKKAKIATDVLLSISHESDMAVAMVVLKKENG